MDADRCRLRDALCKPGAGTYKLDSSTIQQDALAIDQLFGETDRDWFLAGSEDQTPDQVTNGDQAETRTGI